MIVVLTLLNEGRSFTGEAMLEIACHGNPLIIQNMIEDLIRRGCRWQSRENSRGRLF